MRKTYPYLQDPYAPDLNDESKKRRFLSYIDDFVNQRQYVKMTLLTWEEEPIKSIEGEISAGSISKDGSSAVRRTCKLSCEVDGNSYNVDDMNMDFTLNKKIFIEIGIKNDSPYYQEYPILWFPQGVFFITDFSMSSSSESSVSLSLGLKDKMAMLNGDLGGALPATVRFDAMTTQKSTGEEVEQKVLIFNIINELVHHYGKEDLNNIIIEDVPLRIRKIMSWNSNLPLYAKLTPATAIGPEQWNFSLTKKSGYNLQFNNSDDVGYIYSDFVIASELYGKPGESVCSILDQIVRILGNYEYFYDEMGIFHFREIKNFLNVTQAEFVLDEMSENDYFIETTNEKAVFAFEDNKNITSISVTPQYSNIKNDYIVHGIRKGTSSKEGSLVMYHLVIDTKPEPIGINNNRSYYAIYNNVVCYTDEKDKLNKLGFYKKEDENYRTLDDLPYPGNFNRLYVTTSDNKIYYWDNEIYKQAVFITEDKKVIQLDTTNRNYVYPNYYVRDWRTLYYLSGLAADLNGLDTNPYYEELVAFWPMEYDLRHTVQDWYVVQQAKTNENNALLSSYSILSEGNYFLDFIDSSAEIGKYAISAIGRRSDVVQDDKINCLFEPEIPNVIFLNIDNPSINISENTTLTDDEGEPITNKKEILSAARAECNNNGHPWTQVREDIYSNLTIGGYSNSAYEKIRYELFYHTNFQKQLSITSLPVFYLEPNSRVSISDTSTNTYGDFMVQNLNITLGPGANMSVTLSEVNERL